MNGRRVPIVRITAAVLTLVAAFCGGALAQQTGQRPAPMPGSLSAEGPAVIRGAQLAAIGGCITCHTATDGRPFAGGLPLHTPYGVIYSTNITPDRNTGIGDWSLDAFTRAMRRGVSRDGHLLYPAFPYPHFTHMSDADIASIHAWLMTREPVDARAPKNNLHFPLGIRPLMAVWNFLYLSSGTEEQSAAVAAPEVARGGYLIDSLGHCGACHTPLNRLGAERQDRALQGGTIEGWDAPALTDLFTRPRPWTQAQLIGYLRTGFASEHGAAAGPMRPVSRLLADASAADVLAIAAYLIALQPAARPSAGNGAGAPSVSHVDVISRRGNGESLFDAACASCHGERAGTSVGSAHPSLSLGTAVNADSPRNMIRIMLDGIDWEDSSATRFMPPFAHAFTDGQIADLANYTRTRFTARGPWPSLDADAVARLRKESP